MSVSFCERIVAALDELEQIDFSQDHLTQIHHRSIRGEKESFARARRYFERHFDVRKRNSLFAARLFYIRDHINQGHKSHATLVEEALQQWPLV